MSPKVAVDEVVAAAVVAGLVIGCGVVLELVEPRRDADLRY